jgi:CopG antitoxin of type II toxin-antitoxin system
MKKARKAPAGFASEAEERAYWEREDSTADLDWRRAKRVRAPNLQPSATTISAHFP